jgi:hypothetical protein
MESIPFRLATTLESIIRGRNAKSGFSHGACSTASDLVIRWYVNRFMNKFINRIHKKSIYKKNIEPTSALDPETCLLVEKSLKDKTCLWISHDPLQEARVASATLTLYKGGDYQYKVF